MYTQQVTSSSKFARDSSTAAGLHVARQCNRPCSYSTKTSFRAGNCLVPLANPVFTDTCEQATELFDIDEDEYTPYPPAFSSPLPSQSLPLSLNDPFNLSGNISSMSEPVLYYEMPAFCSSPKSKRRVEDAVFVCSVCSAGGGPLAILEPCEHPLCSACLTSALNIVGEKDMECAVCKAKVDNFQLRKPPQGSFGNGLHQTAPHTSAGGRSHGDLRVLDDDGGLLPSAFDGGALRGAGSGEELEDFMDRAQGASTPVAAARGTFDDEEGHLERPVLRIDNVPWVRLILPIYCALVQMLITRRVTNVGHHTSSYRTVAWLSN